MAGLAKCLIYAALFGSLAFFSLTMDASASVFPAGHWWVLGSVGSVMTGLLINGVRLSRGGRGVASLRAVAVAAALLVGGWGWFSAPSVVASRRLHQVVRAEARCNGASAEPLNRRTESGLDFVAAVCAEAEIARIRWNLVSSQSDRDHRQFTNRTMVWAILAGCWIGVGVMPSDVLGRALDV